MNRPRQIPETIRTAALAQDVEFLRFLGERLADAQREADRCQHEIDTRLAEVDSIRREQAEHLNIVGACTAGIHIADRSTRPAPQLTDKEPEQDEPDA